MRINVSRTGGIAELMSHHKPLAGRAGIVTGGALGIGGGTARRLADDGASILIVDIVEDAAQRNAQRINDAGGSASYMIGDVAQEDVAKAMVARCVDEYGRLDILIQNAYGGGSAEMVRRSMLSRMPGGRGWIYWLALSFWVRSTAYRRWRNRGHRTLLKSRNGRVRADAMVWLRKWRSGGS